ncbi:helix-turn-helix domain-containing protein [Acetobacterium wieringae]|uniref:Transcriptional repressor DicA n=1 Tax=Acetobacterium wieringae TaxID=52694 RepID=A0A1F2PD02_9FIRM|nr:helix-turn-helix transcriptional regulator [Acetobacterium wieringae]OFV68925.1 transcriptional repressor DicA [Acetobacterium wieringae]
MNIGERIKKEREQLGWSQEALAFSAGVSQRCISHYELGQREPQYETIKKIMKALGFQVQLVKMEGEK